MKAQHVRESVSVVLTHVVRREESPRRNQVHICRHSSRRITMRIRREESLICSAPSPPFIDPCTSTLISSEIERERDSFYSVMNGASQPFDAVNQANLPLSLSLSLVHVSARICTLTHVPLNQFTITKSFRSDPLPTIPVMNHIRHSPQKPTRCSTHTLYPTTALPHTLRPHAHAPHSATGIMPQ